jgi:hypothetical protein
MDHEVANATSNLFISTDDNSQRVTYPIVEHLEQLLQKCYTMVEKALSSGM